MGKRRASLCLAWLLAISAVFGEEPKLKSSTGRQLVEYRQPGLAQEVLVVSLLDGHVVAVEPETGRLLWTFDSGAPLVSSKQASVKSPSSPAFNVFPGADGGLYAYHGMRALERLPISLPELVEAAPSMTADGSMIVGRQECKIFVLDKHTGRPVWTVSDSSADVADRAAVGLHLAGKQDSLLYIGRQDFTVRSVRLDTQAEMWNATFARMYLLNPDNTRSVMDFLSGGRGSHLSGQQGLPGMPRLVVGADNSLQAYDSLSGYRKWSIAFGTPPIAAYTPFGYGSNFLAPQNQPKALPGARRTQTRTTSNNKIKGNIAGGTTVLVGALHGSLYALPADHLTLEAGTDSEVVPLPLPTSQPLALEGKKDDSASPHEQPSLSLSPSAGSLSVRDDAQLNSLVTLEETEPDVADDLDSLVCPTPKLGIHNVRVNGETGQVPWLPDKTATAQAVDVKDTGNGWSLSRQIMAVLVALLLLPTLLWGWRQYIANTAAVMNTSGTAQNKQAQQLDRQGVATKAKAKSKSRSKAKDRSTTPPSGGSTAVGARTWIEDLGVELVDGQVLRGAGQPQFDQQAMYSDDVYQQPGINGGYGPHSRSANGLGHAHAGDDARYTGGQGGAGGADHQLMDRIPSRSYVDQNGAVVIGRLRVGPGVLGYGSAGTIVYEGVLDGRPVAVKRLLRQFYDLAFKEIQVLIVSDEHPNVVRCFAMEEDREFVYLALERCKQTLSDWIGSKEGQAAMLDSSGCPTPLCMQILSDIVEGLAALHERSIVHRDLKPHNVLLTESGRAKLSDMGLSKQLVAEQSSFESHGSGGSSGWQAPEQLIVKDGGNMRQTRAMDIFSLGCIMYYCITGGGHPFGETYERDTNILKNHPNLKPLQKQAEALNLISAMLTKNPEARPNMTAVLGHPLWWSVDQRLQLLVDVSDRVENEDREPDQTLLSALERFTQVAVGHNWGAVMDAELIGNLGIYRRYDYTCLRDLLRVIRNKRNHFREMPESLQQLLGPIPDGYYRYFSTRFPNLLLAVFFFALQNLSTDANLRKYWSQGPEWCGPFWDIFQYHAGLRNKATKTPGSKKQQPAVDSNSKPTSSNGNSNSNGIVTAAGSKGHSAAAAAVAVIKASPANGVTHTNSSTTQLGSTTHTSSNSANGMAGAVISYSAVVAAAAAATSPLPAKRPANSSSGPSSGKAALAGTAVAPAEAVAKVPDEPSVPIVGYEQDEGNEVLHTPMFPRRPDKATCDFYMKTGHCKYGEECCFDHPPEYAVSRTELQLPFRPGETVCVFYLKNNQCKYGPACKFHHPKLLPIYAGSAVSPSP